MEALAEDYRRIVELVAATWVRAEGSAGEPSPVGNGRQPSRSPCRPLTAGQPCPEQPCRQTWNGPGRDQPGLFPHGPADGPPGSVPAPGPRASWGRGGGPGEWERVETDLRCWWLPSPRHPCSGVGGSDRGVRTFPPRAIGRAPRPMRRTTTAPTRRLARRDRLGCTEAHHRDLGSRVLWNWTALTPEPGPAVMPRTPLPGIAPHTSPGRMLAFRSRERF